MLGSPSFSSATNNAVVTVQSGYGLGVPLGLLGTALTLSGNNVTLNNAGRIDPSLLGLGTLASTGTVVGNANASTVVVNNLAGGQMQGVGSLLGVGLSNLNGMALEVRTGAGGTSTLSNAGVIGSTPLLGISVLASDTPVIAVTGGGQVNMTNTGIINGRAGFQTSTAGNTFTNAGIINGSLSMGAGSANVFNAVSGSQVNAAGGLGLQLLVQNIPGLTYAATGTVDGGANGNNTLVLQNAVGGGTGLTGGGVISAGTYVNFNRLIVDSGTWDLSGALLTGSTGTTLNGGLLRFDNAQALGAGGITVNGGGLQSNVAGVSLGNALTLNGGALTVDGANNLRLNGVIAGTGGLTKTGTGLLTLGAVNTYTGPTTLAAGGLNLINPGAVNGAINVTGAASLQGDTAMTLGNAITLGGGGSLTLPGNAALTLGGAISGAGSLIKQGAAGLTLTGQNTFTGGTALNAGTLILDNSGALGTGALNVGGNAALGSTGVLNLGNAINLAGNTLTLLGAQATTLSGVIGGVGGALVKAGGADLTLTGSNTYSGGTQVAGGTLTVGGNNALGTGALTLAGATSLNSTATVSLGNAINLGSSTLNLIGSNAMSLGGAISGTGGLVKNGAGSLALNGASSFGGGVALNGGALTLGNGAALGTDALTLGANASLDAGAALVVNNAVTLGSNTLTLPGSNALTLNGVIGGTGSLVKNGAAGLTLAGANTFTGGTTLAGGTLTVGSDAALGTGALTLGGSAGLQAATAVNLGNAIALGSNSLTVSGADARLGGVVSGSGNLIKSGSGNLTLGQANTFSGGLTLNTGTLTLADAAALGTGALAVTGPAILDTTAPLTLANAVNLGANLSLAGSNDLSLNGPISGIGGLTKNGAGTLLLSGANSQQGATVLNAGRLVLGSAGALGSGSLNTAVNTRLDSAVAGLTLGNAINLTGNLIVDGGNALNLNGVVAGAGGLIKNGTAGLTLQGANTFTGGVALNSGALVVGNAAALGSGALTLGGNAGLSANTDLALGNAIALDGNTLTLGGGNALNLGGVINGTGGLIKTGPGGLTLSGANTFSGGVTLNQGPLAVANDLALGSGVLNLGSNATVNAAATVNLGNAIALNGNILNLGGASAATLNGIISGAGGLSKVGPANLTLAGANTFTGGLTLNTGTLTLANAAALGTGALTVAGASTLAGAAGLSVGNAVILNDALTVVGDGALALGGALSGTGTLIKSGTGSLALGGSNTFSGGTTLNAGLLAVSDSAALGTGALQVNGNAGLRADAAVNLNNAIALGANALELTGAAAATLSGTISGSGTLVKTGAGDLSLTAANTFTGGVGLNTGRLSLGNANALGSGTLTVGGTATLQTAPGLGALSLGNAIALGGNALTLAGAADTTLTGTISGTGGLAKVDSGNLTLAGNNTFSGGLTLASGTLTLANAAALGTGALGVTGAASLIGQGDLALNNALTLGAALTVDGASGLSLAGAVDGAGSLIKNGPGTLTLGAANTFSGGVALNGGTLAVGDADALGTGGLSVNADAALDATAAVTLANAIALNGGDLSLTGNVFTGLSGVVSGTGGLVKNGNDTLQLNGANTFAGGVTLNAGTVQLGNADALGTGALALGGDAALATTSDLALANAIALGNSTLTLIGDQALAMDGLIQGGGALVKNGTATLALNGANAFSGGVALNGGTLLLGNDAAMGSGTLTLGGSAALDASTALNLSNAIALQGNTLNVLGNQDLALTGTVSGSGGLTKNGLGNLTLASGNSFTGGLTLNGGRLTLSDAAALGTGALTVTGAALLTATQDLALGNAVTLGADLSVDGAQAVTLNGPVNGGSGLIKLGTGSLTLAGANGFGGGVQLQAGSLGVGNDDALGTGVLNVGGDAALITIADVNLANAVLLNGSALTLTGSEDTTLTGVISGTGALVKTGVGGLTLAGNNTFSGGLTLDAGTLTLADAAALGSGTLSVTGAASLASEGALAVANAIDLATDLTLTGTDDLALAGDIGGAAGLIKTGPAALTLSGDNTFAGGIALNAGTLIAGSTQALGTGALTLGGAATLDTTTNLQLNNAIVLGGNTLTLPGSNDLALQGVISGAGGLVKAGAADLSLGGANTFSGVLDVLGGSVTTLVSGALGNTAGVNLGLGTQLNLGATTGLASLTGNGTVNVGLGTALTLGAGALDNTFDGVLQGAGDLIKAGTGALTLTGDNVLTGTTTVASGLLNVIGSLASGNVQVGAGASLGGSGTLTGIVDVANGGRLIADAGAGLTLGGLTLNSGSILDIGLGVPNTGGPGVINVGGNLVLDGTLNITDIGGFGTGLYHLIDYAGTLIDNGLTFGDLPGNVLPGDLEIQTAVAAQINLLVGGAAGGVQFWDGSQTIPNGTIEGGNGIWNTTATNWTDVGGTLNSAWGGTFAVFLGTPGTVTVEGLQTATGLQFVSDGYRLTGPGQLAMVNGGNGTFAVRVNPNATATLDTALVGVGQLAKLDSGTLVLNGANLYTGGTRLQGGTLVLGNGAALGVGTLVTARDTHLDSNQAVTVANAVQLEGPLTIAGSSALTLAGSVSGVGSLIKAGVDALTLSGANTFSGGVDLNAGTLIAGSDTALGAGGLTVGGAAQLDTLANVIVGNAINLGNDTLTLVGTNDTALTGAISGTGALVKNGTTELALTGPNTFTGGVNLNAGTLIAGSNTALGAGDLTLGGAAQLDSRGPIALANGIDLAGNALTLLGSDTLALDGTITGAGALIKTGAADLTLSGDNLFSAVVDVQSGSLTTNGSNALGETAGVNLNAGTALNLGASTAIAALTGAGDVNLGAGNALTIGNGDGDSLFGGALNGLGELVKAGAGNLTLTGISGLTGDTTVQAGTLNVSGSLASGNVQVNDGANLTGTGALLGSVTLADGAHLIANSGATLNTGALTLNGGSILDFGLAAPSPLALVNANGNLTLDGTLNVTDLGGFGTGVYRLIDYTGTLIDNGLALGDIAGVVQPGDVQVQTVIGSQVNLLVGALAGNVQFWDGAQAVANGAIDGGPGTWSSAGTNWTTVDGNVNNAWGGGFAIFQGPAGQITVDGTQAATGLQFVTDGYQLSGPGQLDTGTANFAVRVDPNATAILDVGLTGAAQLTKLDAGTLVLNAANTYTGGTVLQGGQLTLGNAAALGSGVLTTAADTALDTNQALALGNGVILGGDLNLLGNNDLQLDGVVSGAGSLTKLGAGTLTLTGANTFTGPLDIQGGQVNTLGASALGNAASVAVGAGTLLNLGSSVAIAALSGAGSINVTQNSDLSIGGSNGDNLFAGALQGAGNLIKAGTGTLALTGASGLTGDTTVQAGTLNVSGSLASGNVQVNDGANLTGTGALLGSVTLADGAHLIANSGATLNTGALTLNGGSILDFGLAAPSPLALVNANGNLTLDGTLNVTDLGGFGTGVYRLIDYTGTLIDNGLALGNIAGVVQPGDVQVQTVIGSQVNLLVGALAGNVQFWDGAQAVANGAIDGGAGTWSSAGTNWTTVDGNVNNAWGGGFAIFQGPAGQVTVDGTQAATGLQFVTDGYQLSGPGQLATGTGSFAVRVDPNATASLDVGVTGAAQLTKLDTGTLVLNAANTYTGGTALQGGQLTLGNAAALGDGALTTAANTALDTNQALALANAISLGGNLNLIGSNDLQLDGVVSGAGSLSKLGAGNLVLSSANTFTGGLSLSTGTLTLAQAAALGTGTLTVSGAAALATRGTQTLTNAVVLDADLQLTGIDDLELAGSITGAGGLDKANTATLVLSGANTFQGGTVLRGGQLIVGNDAALGQGGVQVAAASVLGSTADVAQLANAMDLQDDLTVIGDTGLALSGSLQGTGALIKAGAGNLTLNGTNTYQGGTQLTAGRLTLGNESGLGSGALQVVADAAIANATALLLGNTVNVADTATLTLDNAADLTLQGDLQGSGNLIKTGAAILALQGSKAFAGTVDVQAGTLATVGDDVLDAVASLNLGSATQLALGGNAQLALLTGAGQADLASGSTLSLGGGVDNAFVGSFSGAGSLAKVGANTLTLSGDSVLGGTTQVSQGTLRVDGNLGSAGVLVADGARLGGGGQITAPVTVADGGRLLGESGRTLGLGSLNLAPGANLDIGLATTVTGGAPLFQVAGDLTLDGTVNVSDLGGFGNGVYRVIGYGGALTDNGLAFGNLPGSVAPGDLSVQTAIANQVNLLVGSPGLDIQFWDGSQVTGNGQVEGGAGIWNAGNTNWTDFNGQANAAWSGNFGVFLGAGGDVTVEGVQALGGLQFVVDGYRLLSGAAGALELVAGNTGGTAVRVDPSATAVLDVLLTGASRLIKLDTGTLVLNGTNDYSGGTLLSGGTLVLGNDTAVGSGTLQTAANTQLDSNRAVNLANALTLDGPLRVLGSQNLALNGDLQGSGALIKQGSADLTLAGSNDFTGGVSLEQGTLIVGSDSALGTGALTAAAGTALASSQAVTLGNAVALAGDLQVLGNEGLDLTGTLSGPGRVIKGGDGRLGLLTGNLFGGGVVLQGGTLVLGSDAALGSGRLDVTGDGNLDVTGPVQLSNGIALDGTLNVLGSDDLRLDGLLSGDGTLNKSGTADLTLTGNNTFSGIINLLTGSLSTVGPTALGLQSQLNVSLGALLNLDGSTVLGSIGGNGDIEIADGTQLNVEGGVFDGEIAGSGTLNKLGVLRLALNGMNPHSGITNVLGGSLWVDGSLASTTVNVADGAVLGGGGTLSGTVAIADGGTLAVSGGQTLTAGNLLLGNAAVMAAGLGVPNSATPALINVLGDLTLDGTLNVTDIGGFGQGVYSLIDYAGALTDNGLTLGSTPSTAGGLVVQTAVANQVNLVVTGNSNVLFWDGAQSTANGAIDGGNGVWTAASSNWTDANGTLNTPWNGSFAVFQAAPGVVTVDGQQAITGLQFSTDGYTLTGDGNLLTRADGTTNLRVDNGVTATVNVALEGLGNLTKYDAGTLVLNAASGYSGGTRLAGGTLVVGNDRALGTGALTAQANTTLDSNQAVTLGNAVALEGTLALAGSNDLTLAGAVSGTGGLVKNGAGTLTLSGSNSYSGGTQVNAGRLQGDSASLQGTIANNAALTFAQALAGTFAGSLSGTGTLEKTGDGTLILTGNNSLSGVTTVSAGTLQVEGRLASTQVQVGSGARLAGSGTLNGAVQLAQGATLALVQSAAPLTLGSLALSSGSIVEASLGAPSAATGAAQVLGDLVLDGTLNVSDAGGFGRGVYQLFTYGGSLTDNGLALGAVPGGIALSDLSVQTAIARQVNLIVQAGPGGGGNEGGGNNGGGNEGGGDNGGGNEGGGNNGGGNEGGGNNGGGNNGNGGGLQFWNGTKTVADGVIVGGDGVWGTASNWTTAQGNIAQSWGAGFGVFAGDAGTVTVNGTQSFTGLQVLTDGYQLVAGTDAALAPVNGSDGSLAPVRVNAGALANIAAPLVGEGGIDKRDAGTLILSGRNSYSGGTQISGGTLIGDTGSLQGTIVNSATLAFQQAMDGVFNGTLSGAGNTVKNGDGTLVMVGEHPTSGAFNVNQGVLQLGNDDTPTGVLGAQVSVASGAALAGSGSVGSLVNRGVVQPGAGGLGIGGDFTNTSDGTLAIDLGAAPDSYLNVGGTANLAGSLQVVNLTGGNGQYTVLTAGQGVQGTFADTNLRNSPFLTSSLDYDANQVTLSVKRNAVRFSSLAATGNQTAVAQALESEGAPTPVVEQVVALQAEEVPASFDALSGEIHASTAAVVMEDSRYVRDALNDRMRQPTCRREDDPRRTLSPTNDQQLTSLGCQGEVVGWARALGGWGDFNGNGNHASVDRDLSGFMLGVDRALDDAWSVGVAAGHTRSSLNKSERNSSATVKSYHLAAYLKYEMDAFAARMGAAYTWHDIETKRDLLVGGYYDRLKAKYKARTAQVFGEVGYAIDAGGVAVEPFAGLAYVNYDSDSAREKGGAGRLKAKVDQDVTYSTLGVRVGKRIVLDNGSEVTPRLSVGWRHAFGDTKPDADLRFLDGGDSFTVSGVPIAKDAAVVEAGLDVSIGERSKLGIGYSGQLSHQARDHGVSVSFSMGF